MSTIDDRSIIDAIIARNGNPPYPNEPPAVRIVEYTNQWGGTTWGVMCRGEDLLRYHRSPACTDVKIIWERK